MSVEKLLVDEGVKKPAADDTQSVPATPPELKLFQVTRFSVHDVSTLCKPNVSEEGFDGTVSRSDAEVIVEPEGIWPDAGPKIWGKAIKLRKGDEP